MAYSKFREDMRGIKARLREWQFHGKRSEDTRKAIGRWWFKPHGWPWQIVEVLEPEVGPLGEMEVGVRITGVHFSWWRLTVMSMNAIGKWGPKVEKGES